MFIFAALMSLPAVVRQLLRDRISNLRLDCANKAGFGGFDYTLPLSYAALSARCRMSTRSVRRALRDRELSRPRSNGPDSRCRPRADGHHLSRLGHHTGVGLPLGHSRSSGLVTAAMMKRYRWNVGDEVTFRTANLAYRYRCDNRRQSRRRPTRRPTWSWFPSSASTRRWAIAATRSSFSFASIVRNQLTPVIREIDGRFANSAFETSTQTELGMAQNRLAKFRLLLVGVQFIAVIVRDGDWAGRIQHAAMSVRERRHELAVMRSLGFTRRMLVGSIAIEGLLIGLAAGALGSRNRMAGAMAFRIGSAFRRDVLILHLTPAVAAGSVALAAGIGC